MAQRGGKRPGAGRKKGIASILADKARDFIAKELDKNLRPIVKRAVDDAKKGDKFARDWLSDRAHGRATQPIAGVDGKDLFPSEKDKSAAQKALDDL